MDPLTTSPLVALALGLIALLGVLVMKRRVPSRPGHCIMCGRRTEPGSEYCQYHESDL